MGDASSIDATVAGFIVWLARQGGQGDKEREQCVAHVTRFLHWRSQRRAAGSAPSETAYLGQLIQEGEPETDVTEAWAAIALLRRYLASDVPEGG